MFPKISLTCTLSTVKSLWRACPTNMTPRWTSTCIRSRRRLCDVRYLSEAAGFRWSSTIPLEIKWWSLIMIWFWCYHLPYHYLQFFSKFSKEKIIFSKFFNFSDRYFLLKWSKIWKFEWKFWKLIRKIEI